MIVHTVHVDDIATLWEHDSALQCTVVTAIVHQWCTNTAIVHRLPLPGELHRHFKQCAHFRTTMRAFALNTFVKLCASRQLSRQHCVAINSSCCLIERVSLVHHCCVLSLQCTWTASSFTQMFTSCPRAPAKFFSPVSQGVETSERSKTVGANEQTQSPYWRSRPHVRCQCVGHLPMLISLGRPDTDVTGVVFVERQQLFIENIKIHLNILHFSSPHTKKSKNIV